MTVGSHEAHTQPLTDERLLAIAETFQKQGKTAEAERTYRTVLARNPHASIAQERLAQLSGSSLPSSEPRTLPQNELAGPPHLQEPQRLGTPPPAPPVADLPPVLPLTDSAAPRIAEKPGPPAVQPDPKITVASQVDGASPPPIELVQNPPSSGAPEGPPPIIPQDTPGWQSRGSEPRKLPAAPGAATPTRADFGIVIRPAGN